MERSFYEHASPSGPSRAHGLELTTVWHVVADDAYNVRRTVPYGSGFIALRTYHGQGRLALRQGPEFVLDSGTFIVVENHKIANYRCFGGQWSFWWFEFRSYEPPDFPLEHVLQAQQLAGEQDECRALFSGLQRLTLLERASASARFGSLLYRWLVEGRSVWQRTPHMEQVERLIGQMRTHSAGWTVAEMAREMHLCERHLRKIFREQTGKSPKEYYDGLRLRAARQLLEQGFGNVTEVSERFGFSSSAHFTKAFRGLFGLSPSHAIAKTIKPPA